MFFYFKSFCIIRKKGNEFMNIVCYGDSNTYGFNPLDGGRYETN